MPATWSSSERPISVRTVWVDGIRHAILSPDDPLINSKACRRSRVSKDKNYSSEYQQPEPRLDRLNSCFANLRVVVDSNLSKNTRSSRMYRKLSAPPCPRMSTSASNTAKVESSSVDSREDKKDHCDETEEQVADILIDQPIAKDDAPGNRSLESEPNSGWNPVDCKQAEGTFDTFWNPLFERVLQWLDLSGRAQSYDFEEDFAETSPREGERKWSPVKRRLSRCKRESFVEKARVVTSNYKLHKDRNPERVGRDEIKVSQRSLPKIRTTREGFREKDGMFGSNAEAPSKSDEHVSRNEVKRHEKVSSLWSPPGRIQLHIVMPNLISKENHASSQESLIND